MEDQQRSTTLVFERTSARDLDLTGRWIYAIFLLDFFLRGAEYLWFTKAKLKSS
jgi:hypothetical protein